MRQVFLFLIFVFLQIIVKSQAPAWCPQLQGVQQANGFTHCRTPTSKVDRTTLSSWYIIFI